MNHSIGITTNGGCEMGVILEHKSVVPYVVYTVARLLHGTKRYGFNKLLFLFSSRIIEQTINAPAHITFGTFGFKLVTET